MPTSTDRAIPEELKTLRQWVVWKSETRNRKSTKVPYSALDFNNASVSDPSTWATFDEAKAAFESGGYSGIGFVFTVSDPFSGVDLDKCRDPQTGEIQAWARDILDSLKSYAEVSQSGTGVHVIVKGKLPGRGRKKQVSEGSAIEMYDQGRFFVMTGNRLEGPETIDDCSHALDGLYVKTFGTSPEKKPASKKARDVSQPSHHEEPQKGRLTFAPASSGPRGTENDEELLRKARNAKNGEKFSALFDQGDLSEYDNDQSRGDLALCDLLAFWTRNDPVRMDRLFRQSKLFRDKWDEPRPGGTYGSQTILCALDKPPDNQEAEPSEDAPKPGIRTWQDIIDAPGKELTWVVEGMVEEGGISLLIARQKAGKSMLMGQMSIDVSFGEPFLGKLPTKKGNVLYVDFENRPQILKRRGLDLGQGRQVTGVHFAAWDRISDRDLGLDGKHFENLKQLVSELKPTLLVIDPLRLATGADTNDAQKVVAILDKTSELLAVNPTMGIVIVHHVKKNQLEPKKTIKLHVDPREWIDKVHGSQALLAHVEIIIGFEQDGEEAYTLATVPRSYSPLIYTLEKATGSQRFVLGGPNLQLQNWTTKQRENWGLLPPDFSRSEGDESLGHSTCDRLIKKALQVGMLEQDKLTKRYKKVEIDQAQESGMSGIIVDNTEVNNETESGTTQDEAGHQISPISPSESQTSPTTYVV